MFVVDATSEPKGFLRHFTNRSDNTTIDTRPDLINASSLFDAEDDVFLTYYYGLLFLISSVNLTGNGLVIYCVLRHRKLLVPANYFVISLACSDLILGIVYPIYNISHIDVPSIQDSLGVWGSCTVIITLALGMLNVSSYNLVGVTVTRFISIKDPLRFMNRMTPARTVAAVAFVWIVVMGIACGLYLRFSPPDNYTTCRYENVLGATPLHIFFSLFFSMIIPLVIMILLYSYMAVIARKQARAIFTQGPSTSADEVRTRMFRHELKMLRMAGTLLGYFTLAWTPMVVYEFVSILDRVHIEPYIRATVRIILHSNSAVNAFIYAGRLREFRNAMRKETSCCTCQRACGPSPKSEQCNLRESRDSPRQNSLTIQNSEMGSRRETITSF